MFFNTEVKAYPDVHLSPILISEKSEGFINCYTDYYDIYPDDDAIVSQFNDICNSFFNQPKNFFGNNREGETCALGYMLEHYEKGGAHFKPVILNFSKSSITVDYKSLSISPNDAAKYMEIMNTTFKVLKNKLLVFADHKNFFQFNFHPEYKCDRGNVDKMVKTLSAHFRKNVISDSLSVKDDVVSKIKL